MSEGVHKRTGRLALLAQRLGGADANPFGREAMKWGLRSAVTVRRGETFHLRFGAAIHPGEGFSLEAAFKEFRHASNWRHIN